MCETSVLLIHYNKNYEIPLVLEAFLRQTVSLDSFEIVIIDDGSDISISPIVEEYCKKGLTIQFFEKNHTGNRALCRKLAVELAIGENIIFLDSDMIPCNIFLEKHVRNLTENEKYISLGYRRLLYDYPHELITPDTIRTDFNIVENIPCSLDERIPMIYMHEKLQMNLSEAWYMCYSHNIALKKNLYEMTQGFDEEFCYGWGAEDVDFGLQLYKSGGLFFFDEEIISYHIYHKESTNRKEQYNRNLLYFYNKYKSYEPEIFRNQHIFDTYSICMLYKQLKAGEHLADIDAEELKRHKNCLFVGFKNINAMMLDRGNCLVSTDNDFAEYKLIGSLLPYEDFSFEEVIISNKYLIFITEFLFLVIKEALRVGKKIGFYSSGRIIGFNEFFKNKIGYTFTEFTNLKKVRVAITPTSENRQNNILYVELIKALNKNGFYAVLDLPFECLDKNEEIFPLNHISNYYCKDLYFFDSSFISIIDKLIPNNIKNSENIFFWGDVSYYNQDYKSFINTKKNICNVLLRTEGDEKLQLKPGIWDREINSFLKIDCRIDGILIIDLTLDNLYFIKELITKIQKTKYLRTIPVTIVTLEYILDENKLIKKNKYYNPENMLCRRQNAVYQFQLGYSKRIIELLDAVIDYENVKVVHSDGSLEEMNSIIRKNSIYIDLNMKKDFNPYVLQSAAFGLQVYTTSDIYNSYNYDNINIVKYERVDAIYDNLNYLNPNGVVRHEMLYYKRKMNMTDLLNKIFKKKNEKLDFHELMKINEENSWKNSIVKFSKILV